MEQDKLSKIEDKIAKGKEQIKRWEQQKAEIRKKEQERREKEKEKWYKELNKRLERILLEQYGENYRDTVSLDSLVVLIQTGILQGTDTEGGAEDGYRGEDADC